jgi:phospholipase C
MRAVPQAKTNRTLRHPPTGIAIDFIAYVSVDVSFCTRVAAVMAGILQMYLVRKHGRLLAGLQVPAGLDLGTRAAIKESIQEAFVSGFRAVIVASSGHNGLAFAAYLSPAANGCWWWPERGLTPRRPSVDACIGRRDNQAAGIHPNMREHSMADPIEHVIVLMMENCSFDRMLGRLPGVDGVDPATRRTNPDFPSQTAIAQAVTTEPNMALDPEHDLDDCLRQISGPCQGFVADFAQHYPQSTAGLRNEIMGYYTPDFLNVLYTLGSSFLTCDHWYSSLPGPTWPNRFFVHSGTSLGHTTMPDGIFHPDVHCYDQPTVYQRLSEVGISWSIYFGDFPQSIVMTEQWKYPEHYHGMNQFYADAAGAEASFPQYCFIEPTYFGKLQDDQHPPSNIKRGEQLIANVYNALRSNQSLWEKSLLVILYDEHGGFYDHVEPPAAVPPDDNVKEFSFAQYGVRVPAILVSPWVNAGVAQDVFDHTSLLKYVTDKWGLGPLGNRVASVGSFAGYIADGLVSPRSNTPFSVAPPQVADDPAQTSLNAHQTALVGFSRYLETQIQQMSLATGILEDDVFKAAGERLLSSMQGIEQHAETAVNRLEIFLGLKKAAAAPPPKS